MCGLVCADLSGVGMWDFKGPQSGVGLARPKYHKIPSDEVEDLGPCLSSTSFHHI